MIKKKVEKNNGIEIDLTGPQGNAFTFWVLPKTSPNNWIWMVRKLWMK